MEQTGLVFNIQKFSIHDGPGVRTTVFLKGCPLRCRWCANPESQLGRTQIMYDAQKCLHCGTCLQICPEGALSRQEDGRIHVDFTSCRACRTCAENCPGGALSAEGRFETVQAVYEKCMQDKLFYEDSGGGVTISGGEGMLQPEFCKALCAKLREQGIHTAIETTGCVGEKTFRELAPCFDLLLFDIKHHDPEKHREGTGQDNVQIIRNLRWAVEQGLDILPRVAVIPGFNDGIEAAAGITKLIKESGLSKVQLLPFHQMGERKYEFLNREYALSGVGMLHGEDLSEYRQVFIDAGLDCFI
ncbi:MAG: glycyl-radical enzyme activating protein [Oscillospiraceae bacterium]|nr:glycyl-radical enzyme activating protein [Oscillospiraceae bacterium]